MANQNPNKKRKKLPIGDENQAKYFGIFLLIAVVAFSLLFLLAKPSGTTISYSSFLKHIGNGDVSEVVVEGQFVKGKYKSEINNSTDFETILPFENDPELLPLLKAQNVSLVGSSVKNSQNSGFMWMMIIIGIALVLIFMMVMRGIQGGNPGQGAASFGKSRARLHKDMSKKVTFNDVAGCEEAKAELEEIVEFLKSPKKFTDLGARIPKGVLLVGPPGTGKTLLAKAVAGEADVPFFSVSGSEFVEMFVGVGASRVRDLFLQGRKNAPCIIFIDELDAVGRSRGAGLGGSHDEREQTLNQILVEMDGFDSSEGLILLAATNRPDILDAALMRPGRFDREVVVDRPDVRAREKILEVHCRKIPLEEGVDLSIIARGIPGFTGADIENLINEAALNAARSNRKTVIAEDLEFAKEKIGMGPERKSAVLTEEDKLTTAYHEAGHAIIGHLLPHADPVHKVTIIPRGRALGLTYSLPIDEKHGFTRQALLERITMALGGRAAEEIKFGKVWISNGAMSDIDFVTKTVNSMVCEWGMSEVLGPVSYGEKEGPVFLGKDLVSRKNFSEKVHEIIDNEVRSIVSDSYEQAKKILGEKIDLLDKLAQALIEKEVLGAGEIEEILGKSDKSRFPILKHLNIIPKETEV